MYHIHISFFKLIIISLQLSPFFSAVPVSGISVAVTTTDNCIHVINTASMREDWCVRSLCITSRQVSVPKRKDFRNNQQILDSEDEITPSTTTGTTTAAVVCSKESDIEFDKEDEHQYLGINRATISRAQAHTLPFIQSDYHWRSTLTVEPRSQWLVCNGYPGQLQAFDRTSQSLCQSYNVVDYTRVSKKEVNSRMYVPSVSHSQFLRHPIGMYDHI